MPPPVPARGRMLTSILVDAGVVSDEQVEAALDRQRQTGRRIGETLVELGAATEEDIGWALAHQLGLPFVDLPVHSLDRPLVGSFPEGLLHRLEVVPLVRAERTLTAALADPTDGEVIAAIEQAAGCHVSASVATRTAIRTALTEVLGPPHDAHPRASASETAHHFDITWDRSGAGFLLFHLSKAVQAGASEIHFLPGQGELRVAYRIQGVLADATVEPFEAIYALLARIGAMGGPSVDERCVHASGRIMCPYAGRELLVDVSLLDHDRGVAVTLGIHERPTGLLPLESLGLEPLDVAQLRGALDRPSGLVIVTGPPRSGRSLTLGALLGASLEGGTRRAADFDRGPGLSHPAVIRVALDREVARAQWQEIAAAQSMDVVSLVDVLRAESIAEALGPGGAGRLVLASTDWTDTFAMLEEIVRTSRHRVALADRLQAVVQQRRAPWSGAREEGSTVFETLHVGEALRDAFRAGATAAELRATALASGLRPLAERIRERVTQGAWSEDQTQRIPS